MEEVGLIRAIASFAFVIGLILLLSWGLKHLRGTRWVEKVQGPRRLQMVEQLYLDSRNKLVLVKCDEEEHLLMIGGGHEVAKLNAKAAAKAKKK
ncbi:MAG: flagellar biosynthetic protein FliO [Rickettsiales bacterium]|nr:flagellar biosynthetic protein FliO [Rickettsiales bacterium]